MPDKLLEKGKEKKRDKTTVFCHEKSIFYVSRFGNMEKNITNSFLVEVVTFLFSLVS